MVLNLSFKNSQNYLILIGGIPESELSPGFAPFQSEQTSWKAIKVETLLITTGCTSATGSIFIRSTSPLFPTLGNNLTSDQLNLKVLFWVVTKVTEGLATLLLALMS